MKRIKVSEEEEGLVLKLRRDKRIFNEGISKVVEFLNKEKRGQIEIMIDDWDGFIEEIDLLKKETF